MKRILNKRWKVMSLSVVAVVSLIAVTKQKLHAQNPLNCYSACYLSIDYDCILHYNNGSSVYCEYRGPFPATAN